MTQADAETRTVTVERDLAFPPEKVWRALTQPHLIAEWLMKNDFAPVVGHHFTLSGDWGAASCEVLTLEPNETLSYSWSAMGLGTVVTMTLTAIEAGTRLRMEQSGFPANMPQAYGGAQWGWQNFLGKLEEVLAQV